MTEQEALAKMFSPGMVRPSKPYRGGVIQIWTTSSCDKSCFGCTQLGNLLVPRRFITVDQFRAACQSLKEYWGVVGMFGANCATHPQFLELCAVMREEIPADQRGIWCNNPIKASNAVEMSKTFSARYSNLNVHLDRRAFNMFKAGWPESMPFGLDRDSRHSPPFVAMRDVLLVTCFDCQGNLGWFTAPDGTTWMSDPGDVDGLVWSKCEACDGSGKVYDESRAWEMISDCDINKHWSAMIGVFRGELRAWFCEVAGAQAMLHQDEPDYPDTGMELFGGRKWTKESGAWADEPWWKMPMEAFRHQVRKHCHECSVPLRGYGELAQAPDVGAGYGLERVSKAHEGVYQPKRKSRGVQVVTSLEQLGVGRLERMTDYLGNARK